MNLSEHLHGFQVTKEGKLLFWCHPSKLSFHVPEVRGTIPEDVLLKGPEAVEKHVEKKLGEAVEAVLTAKRERSRKLDAVRVELETLHGSVRLKGALTNTIYGGQAVWDIHLTEPLGFEGRDTLYCRKYPAFTPDNELLSRDCEPTFYALELGKRTLIKLYEKRRHERTYPIAYDVLRKLKLRKDHGEKYADGSWDEM